MGRQVTGTTEFMEFLQEITYWHWWIFAALLIVLEIFAPGALFMWLAIAAGITGIAVLLPLELNWQGQLLIFAVVAVASSVAGRVWVSKRPIETDHPNLNQRGQIYIGRELTLTEPITNGMGKAKVDDSVWQVSGPQMETGTKVRVINADGATLIVEPLDQTSSSL